MLRENVIVSGSLDVQSGQFIIPRGTRAQRPTSPEVGSLYLEESPSGSFVVTYTGASNYDDGWESFGDRCFVKPLQSDNTFVTDNRKKNYGVLAYGNDKLKKLNVNEGDIVSYKNKREFEFVIDRELVYCMKSNDILINHGQQRNKKEYNTSWAQSS